jgi:hypothetical protein
VSPEVSPEASPAISPKTDTLSRKASEGARTLGYDGPSVSLVPGHLQVCDSRTANWFEAWATSERI